MKKFLTYLTLVPIGIALCVLVEFVQRLEDYD